MFRMYIESMTNYRKQEYSESFKFQNIDHQAEHRI